MKVGLVYDPVYLLHDTGAHVENKHRLIETMAVLKTGGLMDSLVPVAPRAAAADELWLVHTRDHVENIKNLCLGGGGWLDADTVVSPESYRVALLAAGGVLRSVDAVMAGELDSAFALVRPPGHHATSGRAMGFCLFNNVAVAARYALRQHDLDRVLVADFDVHHGNGTQDIFYSDPKVLYFSTHEYPWYPGSGAVEEDGAGPGKGYTVNVPLPAHSGDSEFIKVFREVLAPVARRFQPQLILVSAGYDAHWRDTISRLMLTVDGFGQGVGVLKDLAAELCGGKIVFALEGGYHVEALPHSVERTLEVLLERPASPDPMGKPPGYKERPDMNAVLDAVKKVHKLG